METKRDADFYMANLGSEMTRLLSARDRGDRTAMAVAAERCLTLADRAIAAETIAAHRREIAMLKTIISDTLSANPQYAVTQGSTTAYFYPFALRKLAR